MASGFEWQFSSVRSPVLARDWLFATAHGFIIVPIWDRMLGGLAWAATLSSYERARPILDAAIAATGGEQRLRAIEDMSIRYRGQRWPIPNTLTREFLQAVNRLTLDVTTIAGVHGSVGTIEDLRRAVQLRTQK